ncbi:hypothetical protein [Thermicanus aegyptius]|uniref:hypothetical protein n=1 Tax=Thermicanus aegyptius TaxID=94009 RepID=UPI00041EC375|nr:hypothetical protein [Thermicanus aegyptius]
MLFPLLDEEGLDLCGHPIDRLALFILTVEEELSGTESTVRPGEQMGKVLLRDSLVHG